MIYSVWNQGAGVYDYYESGEQQKTFNAPAPNHIRSTSHLGATIKSAAWPLPSDARRVGAGDHPVGRIAMHREGLGFLPEFGGVTKLLLLAGAGWLVLKVIKR